MRNGAPSSSFSHKDRPTTRSLSHSKDETAPLKALPSTPEESNAFETDGTKSNGKFESRRSTRIISEEKTHFGQIVNGNVQERNNLSGNVDSTFHKDGDEDFAPIVPKRMSSIRTIISTEFPRDVPSPPVPEHKDQLHVSQGIRQPLSIVNNKNSIPNLINDEFPSYLISVS